MAVVIVGMLDEREEALKVIKEQIEKRGHRALLMDITVGTGALVPSLRADVTSGELLEPGEGRGEDFRDGEEGDGDFPHGRRPQKESPCPPRVGRA